MNRREALQLTGVAAAIAGGTMVAQAADEKQSVEVKVSREKVTATHLFQTGNLAIWQTGWVGAQLGEFNSAVTVNLNFVPTAVFAFISDINLDRGDDSIKMSKIRMYIESASLVPGKQQVRIVYALRALDDAGNYLPGTGKITLLLGA